MYWKNKIDMDQFWKKKFEIEMAEIKYYINKYSSLEDEQQPDNIKMLGTNKSHNEHSGDINNSFNETFERPSPRKVQLGW